ncbi:DUF1822 family protein [Planktothrix sp. FACHB-1365]|uniref:DUF1822 family protein n=1 Tax=Planktothrix sp. FACHB-1365 TaxID=2692855 RepID=UPI001687C714|nr:DUF1822 family protein [Planktothrix sp. FACHB-1365]MBD2485862.1 DUF1822 family protein [Planktothrix sp. FACHB-1365]
MNSPLTIPLTLKDRDLAQRFKNQQPNPQKADQVYSQTLAVLAVDYYCQWLGIETDLDSDDSWNPIVKLLSNSADLTLKNIGKIECLPLLPGNNRVKVPVEALADRIGYIVVQLSDDFRQGNLLGFVPSVSSGELKIEELRSLLEWINYLETFKEKPILTQWLKGIFTASWEGVEMIESMLESIPQKPAFNFRSHLTHLSSSPGIKRGKLFNLERNGEEVALFIKLNPVTSSEIDISVQLSSFEQLNLPQDLQMMVLDETGKTVMQSEARGSENLQFNFRGEQGEAFSVKIVLGEVSIIQDFVV